MKKTIGKEYIQENEKEIISEMISEMKEQVDRMYLNKPMKRQVHTKMHGCVEAKFIVHEDIPESHKVGVFKIAKEYDSWVRFSNASTQPKADKKKDIRGAAIKLMGVQGKKILEGETEDDTQDFLLMSNETFFSHSIQEFRGLMKAATAKSSFKLMLFFLNPFHFGLLFRMLKTFIKCKNPLSIPYWSTQPYRFGSKDSAVKYFLKPSDKNKYVNEDFTEHDYLSINLSQTLNTNEVEFDFCVQQQTNADTMPIEDPTVPWKSKFVKVATLKIIKQQCNTDERKTFGENLSFNPWHSLEEHKPLGGFNRVRKVAYITMSKYRHEKNHVKMFEPQKLEI